MKPVDPTKEQTKAYNYCMAEKFHEHLKRLFEIVESYNYLVLGNNGKIEVIKSFNEAFIFFVMGLVDEQNLVSDSSSSKIFDMLKIILEKQSLGFDNSINSMTGDLMLIYNNNKDKHLFIRKTISAFNYLSFNNTLIFMYRVNGNTTIERVLNTVNLNTFRIISKNAIERFLGYIKKDIDPFGINYHINQTKISIGSGGLFGIGFGKSVAKINYLPEPIGDSIFAVLAEEFGFIGSMIVLFLFLFFVLKIFKIVQNSNDLFSKYLCFGFGSMIGIQAFIHIAVNSGLFLLTGQPLPFISYVGSNFIVYMIISSIIFKIAQKKN
jgi:hypothetical protein